MARKQGLGKGLKNIFEDNDVEKAGGVTMLRVSEVEPRRDQPRKQFDEAALKELSDSITIHGVLQPILVREGSLGMYEIIAGERRWRAAKLAGLSEIPVLVIEADELKAAEIALIENIQREALDPFEEAAAYVELMQTHGMTQEEVADKLGKRRPTVTNTIRLLELPADIVKYIREGLMTASHGKTLLGLEDKEAMLALAERIVKRKLSVRETEAAVKREKQRLAKGDKPAKEEKTPDTVSVNYTAELESRIMSATGRQVHIVNGKGKRLLQIEFADNDDLQEIIEKLCGGKLEL